MSDAARVTVRALVTPGADRLARAGVDAAELDARLLLGHVLGVSPAALLPGTEVTAEQRDRHAELIARRAGREPLQHIVGNAAFRYLSVAVGPGVFVPRPETELLVDAVLPALRVADKPVAVDLCSGSGALALAVAGEVPAARVVAVEDAPDALSWLSRNAAGTRVEVVAADIADPDLLADLHGRVTAVVCNPPYVPAATPVGPEVRFDPERAVFAGVDGLAMMPAVLDRSAQLLHRGGMLALEHDDTHGDAVPALLLAHGAFVGVGEHRDLAGRPRYATAVRA